MQGALQGAGLDGPCTSLCLSQLSPRPPMSWWPAQVPGWFLLELEQCLGLECDCQDPGGRFPGRAGPHELEEGQLRPLLLPCRVPSGDIWCELLRVLLLWGSPLPLGHRAVPVPTREDRGGLRGR